MARVSIYVPDDMKSEMDALEEKANWSNVAQQAFGLEINRLKLPEEGVMNQVIERLRASKRKDEIGDKEEGLEAGRKWASKQASFKELKKVGDMDDPDYIEGELWKWFDEEMGIDSRRDPELSFSHDGKGGLEPNSDEYVEGFIEGAQQIWNEIADKI
jgi:hypothetical protein